MGEGFDSGFQERVYGYDTPAVFDRLFEGGQHPRMIGARVLADHHHAIGVLEVIKRHGALADADRHLQRGTAGLVAHVGAIGQVVGAVLADEELVEKRGLVAGSTGRVENRVVGSGGVELLCD